MEKLNMIMVYMKVKLLNIKDKELQKSNLMIMIFLKEDGKMIKLKDMKKKYMIMEDMKVNL